MKILLLAEHDGQRLNPAVYHAVTAAQSWNGQVDLLVAGSDVSGVLAEAAAIQGVQCIVKVAAPHLEHPLAEDVANIIAALGPGYQVILAAHSSFSKNILPRAAALLDVAMISDVLEIRDANTYTRSIYAGNVHATVQSLDATQVLTVHSSHFSSAVAGGRAEVIDFDAPPAFGKVNWIAENHVKSDRPALTSAKTVISGGRSLGSAEKFEQTLAPLAAKLGAALGATRAAVDAGYAPNEMQVGQTGVVVAPDLYIAIGISGAVQHTYGMKDSRVVVAINQDPDAPIFQVADYGLVADLFEAVPALLSALNN
jgi:electron transfer flavoprotein alpha subunit